MGLNKMWGDSKKQPKERLSFGSHIGSEAQGQIKNRVIVLTVLLFFILGLSGYFFSRPAKSQLAPQAKAPEKAPFAHNIYNNYQHNISLERPSSDWEYLPLQTEIFTTGNDILAVFADSTLLTSFVRRDGEQIRARVDMGVLLLQADREPLSVNRDLYKAQLEYFTNQGLEVTNIAKPVAYDQGRIHAALYVIQVPGYKDEYLNTFVMLNIIRDKRLVYLRASCNDLAYNGYSFDFEFFINNIIVRKNDKK